MALIGIGLSMEAGVTALPGSDSGCGKRPIDAGRQCTVERSQAEPRDVRATEAAARGSLLRVCDSLDRSGARASHIVCGACDQVG